MGRTMPESLRIRTNAKITDEQENRYVDLILKQQWPYKRAIEQVQKEFNLPQAHSRKNVSLRINQRARDTGQEAPQPTPDIAEVQQFEQRMLKVFERAAKVAALEAENKALVDELKRIKVDCIRLQTLVDQQKELELHLRALKNAPVFGE
ncbi:MAG: hypothetical protein TUN42_04165 [Dehalogenimonas sp.]